MSTQLLWKDVLDPSGYGFRSNAGVLEYKNAGGGLGAV